MSMLCLDMKLITRFRSDKRQSQDRGTPTNLSPSGTGATSSTLPPGLVVAGGLVDPLGIPRRDRSKSLCVDRLTPLLSVEGKKAPRDDHQLRAQAMLSRRCSTTNALFREIEHITVRDNSAVFDQNDTKNILMQPLFLLEIKMDEDTGEGFILSVYKCVWDERGRGYGEPLYLVHIKIYNKWINYDFFFKYGGLRHQHTGSDVEGAGDGLSLVPNEANFVCPFMIKNTIQLWQVINTIQNCDPLLQVPRSIQLWQVINTIQNCDPILQVPRKVF
ncbi:unnamed protein product, partial [Meganyctiphanes norvegica]